MVLIISLLVIFFDQLVKARVVAVMDPGQSSPVLKNIFYLTLVHNPGAAFGIFPNATLFFVAISIASVMIIGYKVWRSANKSNSQRLAPVLRLAFALILGGALGNLIDRLRFGFVVDFLDFRIWPVFNIADSAITIGTVVLILHILRRRKAKNEQ